MTQDKVRIQKLEKVIGKLQDDLRRSQAQNVQLLTEKVERTQRKCLKLKAQVKSGKLINAIKEEEQDVKKLNRNRIAGLLDDNDDQAEDDSKKKVCKNEDKMETKSKTGEPDPDALSI